MQARSSNPSLWSSSATSMGSNIQGINNQELLVRLLGQLGFTTPTNVAQSTSSSTVTLPSANMVNPVVYHTHASPVPNFIVGPPGFNTGPVGYFGPSLVYHTTQDPTIGAWNMDTGASSHLNNSVTSLCDIFNICNYPSVLVGDGHSIPVTNIGRKQVCCEILERAHMVNCNPSRTPVDTESKLGADGDPVSDPTLYRSLAGSLQYLTDLWFY
ncbi:ribonuclease H-like domain-containing protein [Tanacetum coccineum]